jgi:ABC-type Fe3+-hydroxamate transport system substrate-binding protein
MKILDQLGNIVNLSSAGPLRIVSLVPSQTELLHYLGLADEVVGITKFCIHPDQWFVSKNRIGGTKNVRIDAVHALKPNLIIANKEENTLSDIELLAQHYPVWVSNITTVDEAYNMIRSIGTICSKHTEAEELVQCLHKLRGKLVHPTLKKTLYAIWHKPWMFAGQDTFITEMMKLAGYENICATTRYPVLTINQIKDHAPDHVLLSSEPFPFADKHIAELQQVLPHTKISLVDAEYFSWYGSRMIQAFQAFERNSFFY